GSSRGPGRHLHRHPVPVAARTPASPPASAWRTVPALSVSISPVVGIAARCRPARIGFSRGNLACPWAARCPWIPGGSPAPPPLGHLVEHRAQGAVALLSSR